jgi:hypothetical protein
LRSSSLSITRCGNTPISALLALNLLGFRDTLLLIQSTLASKMSLKGRGMGGLFSKTRRPVPGTQHKAMG